MSRHADDVVGLLDELKITKAVFVGLSMGGYILFEMMRRYRDRVRALVLADTKQSADNDEARAKRRAMMDLANSGGAGAVADAQITGMVGKSTRERNPEVADGLRRMMAGASVPGILGGLHALMERPDSTSTVSRIDVPTLIIVGEEDVLTPPREAKLMAKAIRGSTIEIIEQAGHASNYERPAAFNQLLTEFITRMDNE
jgi:pimeloyl-ACP methyl ester carboxylesterase